MGIGAEEIQIKEDRLNINRDEKRKGQGCRTRQNSVGKREGERHRNKWCCFRKKGENEEKGTNGAVTSRELGAEKRGRGWTDEEDENNRWEEGYTQIYKAGCSDMSPHAQVLITPIKLFEFE